MSNLVRYSITLRSAQSAVETGPNKLSRTLRVACIDVSEHTEILSNILAHTLTHPYYPVL